jgi:predicted nucleic acid-binding protein
MTILLDTDICSSIIRNVPRIMQHYAQHSGSSYLSVVSITELELWLLRFRTPLSYRQKFFNFQQTLRLLDVTEPIAHRAAMITNGLKSQGQRIGLGDSFIAATALEHGLTLVSRNLSPFTNIPGLTATDWSTP